MQAVEGWGAFPSIVFANPVSIATLVSFAIQDQVPKDKASPTQYAHIVFGPNREASMD